jgi:hypothetical protein
MSNDVFQIDIYKHPDIQRCLIPTADKVMLHVLYDLRIINYSSYLQSVIPVR